MMPECLLNAVPIITCDGARKLLSALTFFAILAADIYPLSHYDNY